MGSQWVQLWGAERGGEGGRGGEREIRDKRGGDIEIGGEVERER